MTSRPQWGVRIPDHPHVKQSDKDIRKKLRQHRVAAQRRRDMDTATESEDGGPKQGRTRIRMIKPDSRISRYDS